MIDLTDFLKLIVKRKFVLLGVPVAAIVVTYFLVRNMPDLYISKSRIATGIVDDSQKSLDNSNKQESEINQEFNNLVQMILLKRMIDQVSYQLILHDLTDSSPYKKQSALVKQMNVNAKKHAIEVFRQKYRSMSPLALYNKDQNGLNEVLKSMGYDEIALREKLAVFRVNNSDYIDIQFESNNPNLSAFTANTLCKEFIHYYDSLKKSSQSKTVDFLWKLMQEKYAAMNQKIQDLKAYKIQNHVLNLNEQAKSVFGQIADFETRKQTAEKDIISYTAALQDIDKKFEPKDRKYLEATMTNINCGIIADKEHLQQLNDAYISSNFNNIYKQRLDSVRHELASKINLSSDQNIFNPLTAKQQLVNEKLAMETTLDLAKNSINSLQREITRLNYRFDQLVPHEAVIQAYENDIDVASREYLEILNKYNETSLQSSFTIALRQIELAMPGSALPTKKALMIILAGIVSFMFSLIVLFILFYFDDSLRTAKSLALKTHQPVLGHLNILKNTTLDLKEVWRQHSNDTATMRFKDLLRSVRFEIEKEMTGDAKLLAVTSMKEYEGKSFFAVSLAYACAMANNKVLLIDGNFNNNTITQNAKPAILLEEYINSKCDGTFSSSDDGVCVMGNKGEDTSLLEIAGRDTIEARLQRLKHSFDIVIVETSALNSLNKAKEWMAFADRCISVFEAGQSIKTPKKQYILYLSGLQEKFAGWVMNKTNIGGKIKAAKA